jgi:multicomponent Na+:H+ antiporter subunit G
MESVLSALATLSPWIADGLVLLGVFVMTVGVYGIIRMPDVYTRLHAASKAVFLGVISLLLASVVTNDAEIIFRAMLIAVFLILTTPVSAHVIARAAFLKGQRMESPDAVDESGHGLQSATAARNRIERE